MNEIFTTHSLFYLTLLTPALITIFAIMDKGDFKKHGPRELWFAFMLFYVLGILGGVLLNA